jgi:hypothetical protein
MAGFWSKLLSINDQNVTQARGISLEVEMNLIEDLTEAIQNGRKLWLKSVQWH